MMQMKMSKMKTLLLKIIIIPLNQIKNNSQPLSLKKNNHSKIKLSTIKELYMLTINNKNQKMINT